MGFSIIDWSIVIVFLAVLAAMAWYANRFNRSVADFLAANRCAGRYLLSIASGAAALGVITVLSDFQKFYKTGFGGGYWTYLTGMVLILIPLTGWISYRLRQTRVLTMPQFLEIRYSRRFRIFAGVVQWIAGVINYGVFPGVTARFFIYFCDIPQYYVNIGGLEINVTLGVVMAILLFLGLFFTITGGQITVMITDFLQGQFVNVVVIIITFYLLSRFTWQDIFTCLIANAPEGKSMVNPFDQADIEGFNPWFFFMFTFMSFYKYRIWQGSQGYNFAAKSPHEAKMAGILGSFRAQITKLLVIMLPICAFTLLHSDIYPAERQRAMEAINALPGYWERELVTVVIAIKNMLPSGLLGLLAATMLAAAISTDDTALHSWGSIFIQDVVLPFRKKHFSPQAHMKMLRLSCFGVAIFAWIFSMLFPLRDYIFMYFNITGSIFIGGAGIAVIGGLYWKRGTTAGAWAGMINGVVLGSLGALVSNLLWKPMLPWLKTLWPTWDWLQRQNSEKFFLNGTQMGFSIALISTALYVIVSLLTKPKEEFDMDKMLHRGKYAVEGEYVVKSKPKNIILSRLGLSEEMSRFDKFIWFFQLSWSVFWGLVMALVGLLWINGLWKEQWFPPFWIIQWWFLMVLASVVVVWFLYGGFRDMFSLFRTLNTLKRNEFDDGVVYQENKN